MINEIITGAKIRQDFINFFIQRGHSFVPSSSLVPGGDQTLLFTNAGMVQFKDVFIGTDKRPYTRAANSQKCMRVAGKHNDLDDVGRDDTHHTFFEMLGNWSFGDYYKEDAIKWAWTLLTEVWGLPREKLWVTCFRDDAGNIPQDNEAADVWRSQPGINPEHILFFGRKDNFWEMAEVGPCGPCSEIHIDRGQAACDKRDDPSHQCSVNSDCKRYLELWNLVFIQYNRLSQNQLEPLPAKHVDTGMGLERIVSVLQNVNSNYMTDLFLPMIDIVQKFTGHNDQEKMENYTPYRVIADHSRAAAFLIADGVVPGNTGRNYICRMIIRRAARFGSKIGLDKSFLADVAEVVINRYGEFYPELLRNRDGIKDAIFREEQRFKRTLESGLNRLDTLIDKLAETNSLSLSGESAFDLYATYGLPLEITKDILQERNYVVDDKSYHEAMEEHRLASGAGEIFGELGGEDVDIYRAIFDDLITKGKLSNDGIDYDPYSSLELSGSVLALLVDGHIVEEAKEGEIVEILFPKTNFYIESGGQVSDTGLISSSGINKWSVQISGVRKPAAGIIVHSGIVLNGIPKIGDIANIQVDEQRRKNIMRNHTATHLLHHHLQKVLGNHARQAGSLVAPDRLRFDFTHPEAVSDEQLALIEQGVNEDILGNFHLRIEHKPLREAIDTGATALFGEKYGEIVRNIKIGKPEVFSNELCGGTHVDDTGDIGLFIITSEGSTAAGIRRIEAVTGRAAYELARLRLETLKNLSLILSTSQDMIIEKTKNLLEDLANSRKELDVLKQKILASEFEEKLSDDIHTIEDICVMSVQLDDANSDTLRQMVDRFRAKHPTSGIVVLGSINNNRPVIIAGITEDLIKRGFNAVDLVKEIAVQIGGSGGGRPTLAQAGGKDNSKLGQALNLVDEWISGKFSK